MQMNDGASLLADYRTSLINFPVSHVWRGYGSALFIEFGKLTPKQGKDGRELNPNGEFTLMIEWSWRIESRDAIECGSWSDEKLWEPSFKRLIGLHVLDISLMGRLPEIALSLSDGMYVVSFMTSEGDPAWALIDHRTNGHPALISRQGALSAEA